MDTAAALGPRQLDRPGRVRIAVVIGVVGVVLGLAFGAYGLYQAWRAPDSFDRTVVGGALTVQLDAGQRVVVYDESASTHTLNELALAVTSPTGDAISVEPYRGTLQYDRSDAVARALGVFKATVSGNYQVESAGTGSGTLAVGADLVDVGVDGAARGVQIAGVAVVVALLIGALGGAGRGSPWRRPKP